MKRILLLAAFPLAAAAQAPAPQSTAERTPSQPAPQPAERQPLNLRLDDTSRRQIMSGSRNEEKGPSAGNLPTLGSDARRMEPPKGSPNSGGAPTLGDGRGID